MILQLTIVMCSIMFDLRDDNVPENDWFPICNLLLSKIISIYGSPCNFWEHEFRVWEDHGNWIYNSLHPARNWLIKTYHTYSERVIQRLSSFQHLWNMECIAKTSTRSWGFMEGRCHHRFSPKAPATQFTAAEFVAQSEEGNAFLCQTVIPIEKNIKKQ